MAIRNTTNSYGSLTKWFHWLGAILIIGMLIYGTIFQTLVSSKELKNQLIYIHKSFGLLILALIVLRWVWRRINPKPTILYESKTMTKIIHWYHELFYLAIFIMLASGILISATKHYPLPFFGLFSIKTTAFTDNHTFHEFCKSVHLIFAWTLTAMITLHILGAIKHHFYNKDDTLRRMTKES